ncbi:MAG: hypothetical protein HQ553_06275 [Chloroflexi bacterium]|nr:hypothetical protein [Chloroflexota bacterium]
MDEPEKLRHLLEHWIEHNEEHRKEFHDWATKAKGFGDAAVSNDIQKAAEHLEEANKSLSSASDKLAAGD